MLASDMGQKEIEMITKLANDQLSDLTSEQLAIAHHDRRKTTFLCAILASLLLHGTIAAALSQAYLG